MYHTYDHIFFLHQHQCDEYGLHLYLQPQQRLISNVILIVTITISLHHWLQLRESKPSWSDQGMGADPTRMGRVGLGLVQHLIDLINNQ